MIADYIVALTVEDLLVLVGVVVLMLPEVRS